MSLFVFLALLQLLILSGGKRKPDDGMGAAKGGKKRYL